MLRIFHNKKVARLTWIVLLVIIGPAFLFWGIGSFQRSAGKEDGNFGKIFGRKVTRQEYVDALKASQLQLRMQFGEAYEQLLKMIDLKAVTIQRLVLIQETRRRHIRITDKEVVENIEKDPSFQRNGAFDKALYESAIKYALRMTPRAYEEHVRQNLALRKLSRQAVAAPVVTDAEIRDAYKREHERIDLDYVSAIPADFAASIEIKDEELKDYFSRKSLDFKKPLSFNLEYVSTDKEHQVTAINARLEKEPLEKIAADMGLQLKETGFFTQADPLPGIGWSQELSARLPDAKPGTVFPPLEMEKKYYILRLKERKEPYVPEFAAVKDEVKTSLAAERAREAAKEKISSYLTRLKEETEKNKSVDQAKLANELGLKTGNTGMFKFGSYLEGIGSSDAFYTAGSALAAGESSTVIEMPSGFFVVRVKAKEALDEQKFAQEKDAVRQKLAGQKEQEAFGKYVEELMKKALQ